MSTSIVSEKSEVDRIVKANNIKERENRNAVSSKKAPTRISQFVKHIKAKCI